ncbi:hypothetical protein MH117_04030 [Paenibacillus sp. ACRRX]|uniref:hypothetical protein n=1 Tax=Paenibacillus sp. ACRRX TaxID=2918206 RepID=UPI001EF4E5F3|nr:hypothetical protein [Paenibacillus sp. ACRRX]MCG7406575.1 hypothetical protein [Paenibacillus sp. ACRRX]
MSLTNVQLPVIILAIITGFISYLYNFRAKKRESYLKELGLSYNEVYTPMYIKLKRIKFIRDHDKKMILIKEFFDEYKVDNSNVRFIGTTSNLETYFELEVMYEEYLQNPGRSTEYLFMKKLESFYWTIENEFWEAHDIIYEDHLQFKSLNRKNIFYKLVIEFLILLHNVSRFLLGATLLFLYICLWNQYIQKNSFLNASGWFDVQLALLSLLCSIMLFSLTKIFYVSVKRENRKSNEVLKKIIKRIPKIFRK